jgi:NADPH-dependent 7-cyano-7-deazaguanine reductase QueF
VIYIMEGDLYITFLCLITNKNDWFSLICTYSEMDKEKNKTSLGANLNNKHYGVEKINVV